MYVSRKAAFAGKLWGATHFGTAEDPVKQADYFLKITQPDGTFILVLDLEENPNTVQGTMSISQAEVFVQRIKDVTGKFPVVYTRAGFLPDQTSILSQCLLYVSNQNMPPILPSQWTTWFLNQYMQKTTDGASKPIDFNRFAGTLSQLQIAWISASPTLPAPPVVKTEILYVLPKEGLRLRKDITVKTGVVYPQGTSVEVIDSPPIPSGDYLWVQVVGPNGLSGFMAQKDTVTGEVYLAPTPYRAKTTYGFHVLEYSDTGRYETFLMKLHSIGKLSLVTIINDTGLANRLADAGVPYVVHRTMTDGREGMPQFSGTESDIQIGRDAVDGKFGNNQLNTLHKNVVIQLYGNNEANRANDPYFYYGAAQRLDDYGFKGAFFTDPDGNPDMTRNPDGSANCPVFKRRYESGVLAYMKTNGHYYAYHGYGAGGQPSQTGNEPGSAIWPDGTRDNEQWYWYGGRVETALYPTVPENHRPMILKTEAGTYQADFPKANAYISDWMFRKTNKSYNIPLVVTDMLGYEKRHTETPYVKGFAYWTLGYFGEWAHSDIASAIDMLYDSISQS